VFPFYFADRFSGAVVHLTAMIVAFTYYKWTIILKLQTKMPTSETDAGILASKFGTG
jgi:hypothetical protein